MCLDFRVGNVELALVQRISRKLTVRACTKVSCNKGHRWTLRRTKFPRMVGVDLFYFALLFLLSDILYFVSRTNYYSTFALSYIILLVSPVTTIWKINVAMHFVNKNALHFFPSSVKIIISVDDFLLSSSRIARWIYRNGNKLTSTEGSSPVRPKSEILRAWEKREIIFSERIISH